MSQVCSMMTTKAPVQFFNCFFLILVATGAWCQDNGLEFPSREGLMYAQLNSDAVLPCELSFPFDEGFLTLVWFKGSTYLLSKGKDGQISYSYEMAKEKYKMDTKDHSLTVISVITSDTANYTCEKNFMKEGVVMKENKTTELIVQDDNNSTNSTQYADAPFEIGENITLIISTIPPPTSSSLLTDDIPSPPGMPTFDMVTSRTAFISWRESMNNNNSPIINYLIHLKKNDDAWEDSKVIMVDGATTQITLKNLTPYTPYQVRVVAKNGLGNSQPSMPSSIFVTLAEVPSLSPLGLNYTSPDSMSILLTWTPPPDESFNGIVKGYIISYEKLGSGEKFALTIADPTRKSATIEKLEPFTNYSVTLMMYNDIGNSPEVTIHVTTAEGVPDKPRILHCSEIKSTSFVVNWEAPKIENGVLKNYQIQWISDDVYKTRIITGHLTNPMSAKISNLEPYKSYQLRVRAETGGGYSEYSSLFSAVTDVAGPSKPTIVNFTVLTPKAVFLQWEEPTIHYKKIDRYFIQYWSVDGDNVRGEVVAEGNQYKKMIPDLPTNNEYKLKIAGETRSLYSLAYYIGDFSDEILFKLEDPSVIARPTMEVVPAGMIAGIVILVLIISAVIVVLACYRSRTCRNYTRSLYYFTVPTNSQSPQSTVVIPPETVEDTKYHEIDSANFLYHVRQMHADSDNGFAMEFDEIAKSSKADANDMEIPAEASVRPENKNKNRYVNITAYDHTRVILQQSPGKPKSSDYINANFIDGYMKPNAYIATQGPLPHTFSDFWQMVWEQGSIVIIMITNLLERGRRKCDLYWPEEGSETFGSVTVKHINTFSRAHYTVRMFSLKSSKNKKKHVSERIVYQYHYTEWPDHGVPEFTLPVLKFVLKSSNENPPGAGPIIIHCSAGVGRTGTYILIDTMIRQIKDRNTVNIPAFLLHIRQQRKYLVQTEEQYMLIHDAIAEYILTQGETEIRDSEISNYVSDLTRQVNGEITPLMIQYNLVTSFSPKPDDMFHALKAVNVCKNRSLEMVPMSVKRVMLPMKPGVEGSDYINATYLHGYNRSEEFIITQHPLEQTMEDFWRMVWDQNSTIIVQLSDVDEEEFKSFWPAKDSPVDIGCFKLTYREDDERKKYNIKEFLLQSTQDDYVLMTRIISPNMKWPESCHPIHQVFDLIDEVQMLHKQNDTGAVVVVDRFGGVEAATFCALWSIYDHMQYDKSVNIYQLAKLYHLKRAGVIGNKENYLFFFEAAESLSKEWTERDKQSSPSSIRLHLGSVKKNGTFPRSVNINSKPESPLPRSHTINSRMESPIPGNGTVNEHFEPSIPRSPSTHSKTETNV